jgi:hypothetical protein
MNFEHQHLQTVPTVLIYISCTVPLKKTTYLQIKIDNHMQTTGHTKSIGKKLKGRSCTFGHYVRSTEALQS